MSKAEAQSALHALLEQAVSRGIPGICIALANRTGVMVSDAAGWSSLQMKQRLHVDHLFGIGSITKVFVAVVILQLAAERRLDLNATPAAILGEETNGIPNIHQATIAQLLNHTSGVPSWEDDPTWIREGRGASLEVERRWGAADTLNYLRSQPPLSAPGQHYNYSNSNYTLLGLIIEKVAGVSVVSEFQSRIFNMLGLRDIYLEGFQPVPAERLPHRYHWATTELQRDAGVNARFEWIREDLIDVTGSNLSVEWAAGGLVASMTSLATLGVALRDGLLLEDDSMRFLKDWSPVRENVQVGHNIFRWELPSGSVLLGHDGDVLGFSASLYWLENHDLVVAGACNVGSMHAGEVPIRLREVVKDPEFIETARRVVAPTAGRP
jgi:D-alanyl-D-alanine carboxypeptidase